MDLSIIIVSYNTAELIVDCLKTVLDSTGVDQEIFVIDNASVDGSGPLVRRTFPTVHLVENIQNRGFAAANNQVMPLCRGSYLFFLNPDTTVMPDTFGRAIAFMNAHRSVGLAGTRIINPDGSLQESVSYRYPGHRYAGRELSALKGDIACVLGAAMIARPEAVRAVRGFDEDFFLYGEDQDICLRIRKAGYEIGYIDEAIVIHLGGQSERQSGAASLWKRKTMAEMLFYRKHYHQETAARIRRADLWKARFRMATLRLSLPFLPGKERARAKLIKYETVHATLNQRQQ